MLSPTIWQYLKPDSDLFIYIKFFKHTPEKYKKLGNNKKTELASKSVAILLMVDNLIIWLIFNKLITRLA